MDLMKTFLYAHVNVYECIRFKIWIRKRLECKKNDIPSENKSEYMHSTHISIP